MTLTIIPLPALTDNYIYLLKDEGTGRCAVVDPAEAPPVMAALTRYGLTLDAILCTHHHGDHVGGNLDLKKETGCRVVGFAGDASRIPGLDTPVKEGDFFALGASKAQILEVPGHTSGHIAFYFKEDKTLFCGDALFSLGCGRIFEGNPKQMWLSLLKLRYLPGDTQIYCAHEYTQNNARFAATIEPNNEALRVRTAHVMDLRGKGLSTIPSTLESEKAANPFLRADTREVRTALDMPEAEPWEIFAEIRARKDVF